MKADRERTYRVHEFAALTGVSVRALHHYDRLGLLQPRRAASRYRTYVSGDDNLKGSPYGLHSCRP